MARIVLVTLVCNRKQYVSQALMSAVNQTLDKSKWLHLIIDNASTDGADKIAEAFANKYSHIRFIRMDKNLGIQGGHNYALKEWIPKYAPEAEIFSIFESDDILPSNTLSEVDNMFALYPDVGETYSDFAIIDRNGGTITDRHVRPYLPNQNTPEGQKHMREMFVTINPVGHQRSYSIKCLNDVGGFNEKFEYANDIEITGQILEKYKVLKIDKVLYIWRQHEDSASAHNSPQQTREWRELQAIFKERWLKLGLL